MIWDATFGRNTMDHNSRGPDFGTNFGTDVFGIPGTNGQGVIGPGSVGEFADFYTGFPQFNTGLEGGQSVTVSPPGSILGNASGWTPVERHEFNYTLSTNVTKVAGKHEIRSGFDFVKLGLDHWQPEVEQPTWAPEHSVPEEPPHRVTRRSRGMAMRHFCSVC